MITERHVSRAPYLYEKDKYFCTHLDWLSLHTKKQQKKLLSLTRVSLRYVRIKGSILLRLLLTVCSKIMQNLATIRGLSEPVK